MFFIRHCYPYRHKIFLCSFLLILTVVSELLLPFYMGKAVDFGIVKKDTDALFYYGGQILLYASVLAISSLWVNGILSCVMSSFSADLRTNLFKKIQLFSPYEMELFSVDSLVVRTTNDITQIQDFLANSLRILLTAPLFCFGGFFLIIRKSLPLSFIILFAAVPIMGLILGIIRLMRPYIRKEQVLLDHVNQVFRENLTGMFMLRAFRLEKWQENRFEKVSGQYKKVQLFMEKCFAGIYPGVVFIFNITSLLILGIGSHQVIGGTLSEGDLMAFLQYSGIVLMSFVNISQIINQAPRMAICMKRISEILETTPQISDPCESESTTSPMRINSISFQDVTFSYPKSSQPALENLSFTAKKGETIAIMGATGSGKSTIMALLMRFYDPQKGNIQINGIGIKSLPLKKLRGYISYVPQKTLLFSGTVKSNFEMANPTVSTEEIFHALNVSQADAFILERSNQLMEKVERGGKNYSGGQKQRLSIARALVRDSQIYLFDDSFSALDYKTDKKIREKLAQRCKNSIVLISTQRIETAKQADKILVLEHGRLAGFDTHENLFCQCQAYQAIVNSQQSSSS